MSDPFSVTMRIAITEAKDAAQKDPGDLIAKLKAAMEATKNHWLVTDEDQCFRSAVGGVMLVYGTESDEYRRLARELAELRKLSALISAAQAGLNVALPEQEQEPFEAIGLMKLWRET